MLECRKKDGIYPWKLSAIYQSDSMKFDRRYVVRYSFADLSDYIAEVHNNGKALTLY